MSFSTYLVAHDLHRSRMYLDRKYHKFSFTCLSLDDSGSFESLPAACLVLILRLRLPSTATSSVLSSMVNWFYEIHWLKRESKFN